MNLVSFHDNRDSGACSWKLDKERMFGCKRAGDVSLSSCRVMIGIG